MVDPPLAAGRLRILKLAARYTALRTLAFPQDAAVPVRGALGFALPETIFRPHRTDGPSGLRDAPRPFVVRVRPLNGRTIAAGESFAIGLHLFSPALLPDFEAALRRVASEGLGPARTPLGWEGCDVCEETVELAPPGAASTLDASLEVLFLTPTELKGWESDGPPPFEVLLSRARDRVSALCSLYGDGVADLDFRGLAERARAVRVVSSALTKVRASRTSARTGQTHPLSGVTGSVAYAGGLAEFLPLLRAACLTGVGRQTVWGHGEIAIRPAPQPGAPAAPQGPTA
jgi:hypothetical protein